MSNLPKLYVEGQDDVVVISALLLRHGVDTDRGNRHLFIKDLKTDIAVLDAIPDAVRANTDRSVGFVIDVDVALSNRWNAVRERLDSIGVSTPTKCPENGFIATFPEYRKPFGVWLMPDCVTDNAKLEHLAASLLPPNDPLWPHAKVSVERAAEIADDANKQHGDTFCKRFRDVDVIKAEIHTWLAWRIRPGASLGTAVNARILGCDSPQAMSFLGWLWRLYEFDQLAI